MPLAGFENFDACLAAMKAKGNSDEQARAICGKLQAEAEGGSAEMADFNNQWVDIFHSGDYGDKGVYGPADLDQIVANFNPKTWKPVAVIGHHEPSDRDPALGQVRALRREAGKLLAQFEKVHPALEALVADGRYPNPSVGLYLDPQGQGPMLRHVAFLGAVPPEVKGLQPIQFRDGDYVTIEVKEEKMSEKKPENSPQVTPEQVSFLEKLRQFFTSSEPKPAPSGVSPEQLTTQLSERDSKIKTLEERLAKADQASAEQRVVSFLERLKAKKAAPAVVTRAERLARALAASSATVKFAELGADGKPTGKEVEAPLFDDFCSFVEANAALVPTESPAPLAAHRGKLVHFAQPAKGQTLDGLEVAEAMVTIAADVRQEHPDWSETQIYAEAYERAQRQAPASASAGEA